MYKEKELKEIIKVYGSKKQMIQAIEEMSELSKELCKYVNDRVIDVEHITEEMSDVQIMLNQLILIFNNQKEIKKIMNKKIQRQLERIKSKEK